MSYETMSIFALRAAPGSTGGLDPSPSLATLQRCQPQPRNMNAPCYQHFEQLRYSAGFTSAKTPGNAIRGLPTL